MRVRLLGDPSVPRARRRGIRGGACQLQPRDHHDRPRDGNAHLRGAHHGRLRGARHSAGASGRAAAKHGRTNRAQLRGGARSARCAQASRHRGHRMRHPLDSDRRGPRALCPRHARHRPLRRRGTHRTLARRGARGRHAHRPSRGRASIVHVGRSGRRHGTYRRRAGTHRLPRTRALSRGRSPHRAEPGGLEGDRDGGHARCGRKRHRGVLHREPRSDGRAHGRLHNGRPLSDAQ